VTGSRTASVVAVAVGLALLVAAVYQHAAGNGFIDFHDDATYVTDNPHVRAGLTLDGAAWALTSTEALNWHPLTWLSHMLDAELFGLDPRGHHLVNVAWHLANTLLLLLVLRAMTGSLWASALAAALFAAHPAHVESVAWIAERKDVLSTFFWLLTMLAYLRYARAPSAGRRAAVLAAFALGLAAKPMLVTLPLVLVLLDCWPLARFGGRPCSRPAVARALRDQAPLLLLSAAAAALTLYAQSQGGVVRSFASFPPGVRLENAVVAYVRYLGTLLWPVDLAFLYPHPRQALPAWKVLGAIGLLAAITALAVRARRGHPHLLVGWLWFVGTLVPVIGLIQVGGQALADRYTYVPFTGLFVAIAWSLARWAGPATGRRAAAAGISVLAVAALATLARAQVSVWKDSVTLFTHSLETGGEDWLLRNNLGLAYARRGDVEAALREYARASRLNPDALYPWVNTGAVLAQQGRLQEALSHFLHARRLRPDSPEVLDNLGLVAERLGRPGEAAAWYREALRVDPGDAQARQGLARVTPAAPAPR
jgi:tetratricopeptide (TPR) repeat protein